MLANESEGTTKTTPSRFDLPEEVLQVLPTDPFQQLDVARKITSIAISTRVSLLESDLSVLQRSLTGKEAIISDLRFQLESLDSSLSDANEKLARADQEKESLLKDNAALTSTVKKLHRDVAKLETFRKALMRSLLEEEENPAGVVAVTSRAASHTDDSTLTASRISSIRSQLSDTVSSPAEDNDSEGLLLASQTSTPQLTPPGSPPSFSAFLCPIRSPRISSSRRHSISPSTTRGMFDDRSSVFSMPPSKYGSTPGCDTGSQAGRARVDGKEFFRQVRSRLSYEQFGAFLANVKDLNSHKQTREDTLRKAEEVLGPDNKDLYAIFEGLITRNFQ